MATFEIIVNNDSRGTLALDSSGKPLFLVVSGGMPTFATQEKKPSDYRAALLGCSGKWLLIPRMGAAPILLNSITVAGMKILAHGDVVELGEFQLRLAEETIEVPAAGDELIRSGLECPWCHDTFRAGVEVTRCPRCGTPHHRTCWLDGGCASRPHCGFRVRNNASPDSGGTR